MTQLRLSGEEIELVLDLLEQQHSRLLVEIRHTDTANFRLRLKERLASVESLIQRFQAALQRSEQAEPV